MNYDEILNELEKSVPHVNIRIFYQHNFNKYNLFSIISTFKNTNYKT